MNKKSIVFFSLGICFLAGACTSKYNIVRVRNDKYLNTTLLTLATNHRAERQGARFGGKTHVEIEYFKETKAGAPLKNEMKISLDLHSNDPDLNDKGVLLINGKTFEIAVANVNVADKSYTTKHKSSKPVTVHQAGKIYHGTQETTEIQSHSYKTAGFKITPSPDIVAELKNPTTISARIYLGTEAVTVEFEEEQIASVKKFYNDAFDEDVEAKS